MTRLQAELAKLPYWVKHKGRRVVVLFEGRDAELRHRHDQVLVQRGDAIQERRYKRAPREKQRFVPEAY